MKTRKGTKSAYRITITVGVICGWALLSEARTLYVWQGGQHQPPYTNWVTAATNITAAVGAATTNDEVVVTNGVYREPGVITLNRERLRLTSVNGPRVTIIDGRGVTRLIAVGAPNVQVVGFTLTNGYVNNNAAGLSSGSAGLVISNCIISGNVTAGINRQGAGIRATANPTIVDCVIVGNRHTGTGGVGGGLYMAGGTLLRCVISGNEATGRGGGVYAVTTAPLIQDCVFENNVQSPTSAAGTGGGALYLAVAGTVRGCTFNNNRAQAYGGAVYINNVAAQIYSCTFTSNRTLVTGVDLGGGAVYALNQGTVRECVFTANASAGDGGGVVMRGGGAVVNCVFGGNTAAGRGGGARLYIGALTNCLFYSNSASTGGAVYASAVAQQRAGVGSCTLVSNTAASSGGGISCGRTRIYNTIVYFNAAPQGPNYWNEDTTVRWRYSCTTPILGNPYDEGGNITNAPLFLLGEEHHYHPATNSPVVNAGTNEAWMTGAQELTPQARIINGRVDMGAYELGRLVCVFKGNPLVGPAPLTVEFTSYITGTNTASLWYYWDFNTAQGAKTNGLGLSNVTWTYGTDGVYSVALIVSNAAWEHASCLRENYVRVISPVRYVATNGPHVAPFTSWATAASNIESAVGISSDYTWIFVSGGTYRIREPIMVTNVIYLVSVSGPEYTIVDGMGTTRCFHVTRAARIEGFSISNGVALGNGMDGYGGGVLLDGAGVVSNCHFYLCRARLGGGAALYNGGWVFGSMFVSNRAEYGGGAYVFGPGIVQNAVVRRNYADDRGGGAFGDGASIIRNCLLYENVAGTNGGGVAIQNSGARVESCTVVSNMAYRGGGIYSRDGGAYYNTISYFNSAVIAAQSNWHSEVVVFDYGRSFWHCNTAPLAGLPNQTGCIEDDPRFRDVGNWNFRLQGNSACINTGIYQAWMDGAVDLDGVPRVREGRVDIGAYEIARAFLVITNMASGLRLPFRVLHQTVAGQSEGLLGMLLYTNRWTDGFREGVEVGEVPAMSTWAVPLHLPHYGRYEYTLYGTNVSGDVASDSVRFERERPRIHFIRNP